MRPYTRSLDPEDYHQLLHNAGLHHFLEEMVRNGVQHREWHPHRFWEYASMMQQLDELAVPKDARIIDVGSGGSFFPPYLATRGGYPNVEVTDSMKYGDVRPILESQRRFYAIPLTLHDLPCEDMSVFPDGTFDVTMCISTIEHVDDHDAAMRELVRITKPGGYIFITSDYFKSEAHWELSISKHLQVTPYTEEFVLLFPRFGVEFVGEKDLKYRGDFVHNYSFVNICLRKPAASTPS